MTTYCTTSDLYAFGLPRGVLPNSARLTGGASVSSNAITLDGHGFASGDVVTFRAEAGGSLPLPLVAGTEYYVASTTDGAFTIASSLGGSAIDITTTGARVVVVARLPKDAAIEWASAVIDDMIPAAALPLATPYPEIIKITCAELAAWKLGVYTGANGKSLTEILDFAQKRLLRWSKGAPIRGESAPTRANLSASASIASADSHGWTRYGGIG